jgi:hypothetical protein
MATTETVRRDKRQRPLKDVAAVSIDLTNRTAVPTNPYDGMIVYTDGVSWNPGSGQGIYAYYNSAWNKL